MYILENLTYFNGLKLILNKEIAIDKGKIVKIDSKIAFSNATRINLNGNIVCHGFIDLQIYGAGGRLLMHSPEEESLFRCSKALRNVGTTHFLITLATMPLETIYKSIEVVKKLMQKNELHGLIGLHLEGPYINPIKKGAHQAHFIRKPILSELSEILTRSEGCVKMMTIAPEMFDEATLDFLIKSGIILSIGHSDATYEQAIEAINKGIPKITHLFNAMSQFNSRAPGIVGAAFDHPSVCSPIIADGVHVDFNSIRIAKKIMRNRLLLITDAVDDDPNASFKFVLKSDRWVDEKGILAGSCLTMLKSVQNCVEKVGIPLEEALRMATVYPAKLMGLEQKIGKIGVGRTADLVIFDKKFNLHCVFTKGEKIIQI